ncbi:DUF6894 family protein [Methylobacterium sp. J-070]|uniref:DUF6894 family protein n=1 Tax=Methylobacterium sp. J-070 TaxID=2836650 RepID=UPI001FB90C61|nr:hypothetical protein [Methylobacterium sp. J-070]MCJ2049816.1 hypothetical protein [Methylobacterium sp. J-070]
MPRYHFNVYSGVILLDKKGVELPDAMFAGREAIRYAGVLLEEGARLESLDKEWRMKVMDGTSPILFRLDFFVTLSSAVSSMEKPKQPSSIFRCLWFRDPYQRSIENGLIFAKLSRAGSLDKPEARFLRHQLLGAELGGFGFGMCFDWHKHHYPWPWP